MESEEIGEVRNTFLDGGISCHVQAAVIHNTREYWLNKAKLVYQLGHQTKSIDLKKAMKIIKCTESVSHYFSSR